MLKDNLENVEERVQAECDRGKKERRSDTDRCQQNKAC